MDNCLPNPVTVKPKAEHKAKKGICQCERAGNSAESAAPVRSAQPFETAEFACVPGLVLYSTTLQQLLARIAQWRDSPAPVLITGETGTGKELIARAVHHLSARGHQELVPFNCAAIGSTLAESQLFGHRRGSFTGAQQDHPGVIRAAEGGTLLLDEIGELSHELQPKLLRFLQEGEAQPVGATRPVKVNVRVIAVTNRNLAAEVHAGRFRADLYYRLNVLSLRVPPLRAERGRIEPLITYHFDRYRQQASKPNLCLSQEAMELLCRYEWPGNVRELCNELQRLVADAPPAAIVTAAHLSPHVRAGKGSLGAPATAQPSSQIRIDTNQNYKAAQDELSRKLILGALNCCAGNVSQAAAQLGMDRMGLSKTIKRLSIGCGLSQRC